MFAFDIDGVIANSYAAILKSVAVGAGCEVEDLDTSTYSITAPGLTDGKILNALAIQGTVAYVDEIQPHEGAIEFLEQYYQLHQQELVFVTARVGEGTVEATRSWLERVLPGIPFRVYHETNKAAFFQKHPEYTCMVEDHYGTVCSLSSFEKVFLVTQPWNADKELPENAQRITTLMDITLDAA